MQTVISVDGSLIGKRGGWGIVILGKTQEWISLGTCRAESSDEIEFEALLQGIRLADKLDILQNRSSLRLLSDSYRVIAACGKKTIRLYCAADWKRLGKGQHVLTESCLAAREEIWSLTEGHRVTWQWTKRNSNAESVQADALARVALGKLSAKAVSRSGLTLDQLISLQSASARERFDEGEELAPGKPLYEACTGTLNVFTRKRAFYADRRTAVARNGS